MAKSIERLSALQIKKLNTKGLYPDGAGLYLQVTETGSKSWILRYTIQGKTRYMGLGSSNDFTLAEARARARIQRQMLSDGIDPIDNRASTNTKRITDKSNIVTFDKAASIYIESMSAEWRNAKHADQWINTISTYASPVIGSLPVSEVTFDLVMKVLQPIWNDKTETANRLRGRIESILNWAKVQGYRTGENPAAWKGNLALALPKPSRVARAGNHAALPWLEIANFMSTLKAQEGLGALAMQLIILTATRTSEVLNATWSEFDIEGKIWTIPKERMKGFKEHRVPLSDAAIAILEQLKLLSKPDNDYVFKGRKAGAVASNMICLQLLKRMGRTDITVHGFRSTFRDWCSENTTYPRDVAEMALAHVIENKSEAAYRRGDLLDKRRELMNDWANYCG